MHVNSHPSLISNVHLLILHPGVAASQDQDFGTANLHAEVSDVVSVLVYVGVAKGNGVLSKTGEYWKKPLSVV